MRVSSGATARLTTGRCPGDYGLGTSAVRCRCAFRHRNRSLEDEKAGRHPARGAGAIRKDALAGLVVLWCFAVSGKKLASGLGVRTVAAQRRQNRGGFLGGIMPRHNEAWLATTVCRRYNFWGGEFIAEVGYSHHASPFTEDSRSTHGFGGDRPSRSARDGHPATARLCPPTLCRLYPQ